MGRSKCLSHFSRPSLFSVSEPLSKKPLKAGAAVSPGLLACYRQAETGLTVSSYRQSGSEPTSRQLSALPIRPLSNLGDLPRSSAADHTVGIVGIAPSSGRRADTGGLLADHRARRIAAPLRAIHGAPAAPLLPPPRRAPGDAGCAALAGRLGSAAAMSTMDRR